MFSNYLKIAIRSLIRHKGYTLINLLGLAIGMTACILMLLFVQDELRYDTFHSKAERIVRVTDEWRSAELSEDLSTAPFPVARMLQVENPEAIEQIVRMYRPASWGNDVVMSVDDKQFVESGLMFADSSFFRVFDFPVIHGTTASLETPNTILLTETTAKKYFGDVNPVGKTLRLNNQMDLAVGGVMANIPSNSHIKFDMLTSLRTLQNWWNWDGMERNWIWQAAWSYLLVSGPAVTAGLRAQLPDFVQRHFPESVRDGSTLHIQPLLDIHLRSQRNLEIEANGNIVYVYIFSAIAILILLIACINFMNLATARSANRAREVGMRKVLGAYRSNLIGQFLGESILLSFIALILTIALLELALPMFNALTGKELVIPYFENGYFLPALLGIGLFVGIIAGSYPAFYLSGFRPILVLKGVLGGKSLAGSKTNLRKILVVSQFVVSLVLLICISIIYNQLNYLKSKDLGYNKDQIVFVDMFGDVQQKYMPLKSEFLKHPAVQSVSMIGGSLPGKADGIANPYVSEGMSRDKPRWIANMTASHDLANVLGLEFLNGRFFSENFPSDSTEAFVISETAAKEFGWTAETAVGKKLERLRTNGTLVQNGTVIGVVKDFHFQPLHEKMNPLIIRFGGHQFAIRLGAGKIASGMTHLQSVWAATAPQWPISYRFLNDDLTKLYQKETRLGEIIQYFTILAIFIACLGLFGLASFTTERRTKEIGVRKILGASVSSLVLLLSREFTKLVLIAFCIAAPIGYWVMEEWLANFAFRIDIGITVFLAAGGIAFLITLATISYQAIKAALSNPVDALRYE